MPGTQQLPLPLTLGDQTPLLPHSNRVSHTDTDTDIVSQTLHYRSPKPNHPNSQLTNGEQIEAPFAHLPGPPKPVRRRLTTKTSAASLGLIEEPKPPPAQPSVHRILCVQSSEFNIPASRCSLRACEFVNVLMATALLAAVWCESRCRLMKLRRLHQIGWQIFSPSWGRNCGRIFHAGLSCCMARIAPA